MQNVGDPLLAAIAIVLIGLTGLIIYRRAFQHPKQDAPNDDPNDVF